jgi:hypothetical protein
MSPSQDKLKEYMAHLVQLEQSFKQELQRLKSQLH